MSTRTVIRKAADRLERDSIIAAKAVLQRVRRPAGSLATKRVALVAGVQRSGTNMVMDVLERSFETDVYHETDPRAFDNYVMRPVPVIRELRRRSKGNVFVIKSLCELQDIKTLMSELAPAQTVWLLRNYDDVVNSMLVSFRNQAKQVQRIAKHRDSGGWWLGEKISDTTYEVIKRVVHPGIDDASAAALQWYFRNVLFFEQSLDAEPRAMVIRYESLVREPQTQFAALFKFLGLRYTKRVSAKVFASSVKKRSPPNLDEPIREVCEELSARFAKLGSRRDRYPK